MLSNKMPHKGLTVFSTLLASSFNWGAPCKSEVTTMGFISKIAVFLSRENISKCYFFQDFFFLPLFPSSDSRPRPKHFLITQHSLLLKGKNKYVYDILKILYLTLILETIYNTRFDFLKHSRPSVVRINKE